MHAEVQRIYDHLRDARFNVIYYGGVLARLQRLTLFIDVVVALGTSGTLATLPLLSTPHGKVLVTVLASIAAVIGVLKPVLNLSKKVERASKLWSGYNITYNTLRRAVEDVKSRHEVTTGTRKLVAAAVDRLDQLSGEDDPAPRDDVRERLYCKVNEEIPPESLWWPPNHEAVAGSSPA